jgi:hypothetical protein
VVRHRWNHTVAPSRVACRTCSLRWASTAGGSGSSRCPDSVCGRRPSDRPSCLFRRL